MGTYIGIFSKNGFPIYRSSQAENAQFDEDMSYNNRYANGKDGALSIWHTPNDKCAYQELAKHFAMIGKYEVTLLVLNQEIKFKTSIEKEQENTFKKVRLFYYNSGKANQKTKDIVEKHYLKKIK